MSTPRRLAPRSRGTPIIRTGPVCVGVAGRERGAVARDDTGDDSGDDTGDAAAGTIAFGDTATALAVFRAVWILVVEIMMKRCGFSVLATSARNYQKCLKK